MIFTAVPRDALGIVWGDVVKVLNKSVGYFWREVPHR